THDCPRAPVAPPEAAELSRVLAHAHQGAATQLLGEDWTHARKYFSLSEKYAAWANYRTPARGFGIHLEGDFTAQDEANLVRLASFTSTALDALARLHLPES